jgi:hypothetical protein
MPLQQYKCATQRSLTLVQSRVHKKYKSKTIYKIKLRMRKSIFVSSLFVFSILFSSVASAEPDTLFKQAISVKYEMPESLKGVTLKKTVTDYNDIVYVLADNGLYRVFDKQVAKDIRYTPLAQKIPVDIAVQEGAKHLYYLYEDEVLTNAYAGFPFS